MIMMRIVTEIINVYYKKNVNVIIYIVNNN